MSLIITSGVLLPNRNVLLPNHKQFSDNKIATKAEVKKTLKETGLNSERKLALNPTVSKPSLINVTVPVVARRSSGKLVKI